MKGKMKALTALTLLAACAAMAQLPEKIACAGSYGGHLQGVATDGTNIYWSFTVAVVKTDLSGNILVSRKAPSHQGDLCCKDGVLYVAVNRGRFNTETGAVSQVTSYVANTLKPIKTVPLPDVPHGAGGITWKGDRFYVVGGLPPTHKKNYVYEYTPDNSSQVCYTLIEDGKFYFGIYGDKENPSGVLACPEDLSSYKRYHKCGGSVGILKLDGAYYVGGTSADKTLGKNRFSGHIVRKNNFPGIERTDDK